MNAVFVLSSLVASCNLLGVGAAVSTSHHKCFPGMSCFPQSQELSELYGALGGRLIFPYQEQYDSVVIMKNTHQTKFPYMIVFANSTTDVQKSVVFARKYNIKVTIQSSGHDYEGRSTGDGSMQIYLGNMTGIKIQLNSTRSQYGEATIESGTPWIKVYEKVDKYNRVIIGGSCHTVAMGGYTQGGGKSPMSRMFGLAIDNLLEIEMVTANGSVIVADEHRTRFMNDDGSITTTNDTDIFWAVRGGGGGTWGVITKFTFMLHPAPPAVVQFLCEYKHTLANGTMVADPIYHKVFGFIKNTMPREWGGYIFINANGQRPDKSNGSFTLSFNHYGGWDTNTRRLMDDLYNYQKDWQRTCRYVNHSSFLEYEKTMVVEPFYSSYVTSILMETFTDEYIQEYVTATTTPLKDGLATHSTGTLIGGKVMEVEDGYTAIHPGFRHALLTMMTSYQIQGDGDDESYYNRQGRKLNDKLRKLGSGMSRNEASADTPVWKDDFWGSNYPRLEQIKRLWDPDNLFTCNDCVGSDL